MFFFTGLTKEYHTPDDDFDTINVEGVVQTIDYAERVLDGVVNLPKRPEYVKSARAPAGRGGLPYLGIVPDYSGTADGLAVNDVNKDSPAAKGGLKAKDVIVQLGETPVANIQGLMLAMRKHKPGDKVKIIVERDKKKVTLTVTLGRPQAQR